MITFQQYLLEGSHDYMHDDEIETHIHNAIVKTHDQLKFPRKKGHIFLNYLKKNKLKRRLEKLVNMHQQVMQRREQEDATKPQRSASIGTRYKHLEDLKNVAAQKQGIVREPDWETVPPKPDAGSMEFAPIDASKNPEMHARLTKIRGLLNKSETPMRSTGRPYKNFSDRHPKLRSSLVQQRNDIYNNIADAPLLTRQKQRAAISRIAQIHLGKGNK